MATGKSDIDRKIKTINKLLTHISKSSNKKPIPNASLLYHYTEEACITLARAIKFT